MTAGHGTLALVGDIGATTARLALARDGMPVPGTAARLATADHASAEALLAAYLATQRAAPRRACLAVAGAVRDGSAWMRNRGWQIEAEALAAALGLQHVHLMNDLQAQGLALDRLSAAAQDRLLTGTPEPRAARLVIGLGTGVNCAPVHRVPGAAAPFVPATEGGAAALPVHDAESLALAERLRAEAGGATVEGALSGRGLARLWRFAGGHGRLAPPDVLTEAAAGEQHAAEAVALYARLLGHAARDMSLAHLALGGVWLAGGLARAIAPHLRHNGFEAAFRADPLTAGIPVQVIADDAAAVLGCAEVAQEG
ncbi:glucokinase [Rhodosalinus sediminis]|uniref:Glucokinase n=1 Tax=Rhodosalinus sediminis TaxID=1940533 RepID=A0A3D9BTB7_9RHOB|nr:glucokinase [Rhodosalinus sediminis]REC56682.1 glucokinase [Rhodosalinus sediminis]